MAQRLAGGSSARRGGAIRGRSCWNGAAPRCSIARVAQRYVASDDSSILPDADPFAAALDAIHALAAELNDQPCGNDARDSAGGVRGEDSVLSGETGTLKAETAREWEDEPHDEWQIGAGRGDPTLTPQSARRPKDGATGSLSSAERSTCGSSRVDELLDMHKQRQMRLEAQRLEKEREEVGFAPCHLACARAPHTRRRPAQLKAVTGTPSINKRSRALAARRTKGESIQARSERFVREQEKRREELQRALAEKETEGLRPAPKINEVLAGGRRGLGGWGGGAAASVPTDPVFRPRSGPRA